MTYEITSTPPDLAVTDQGRLDTLTSPKLESELEPSVATAQNLVLDLAGVDYLSSAGLRLLLTYQKRFKAAGGTFKLVNVQSCVLDILRMTGFLKILTVE